MQKKWNFFAKDPSPFLFFGVNRKKSKIRLSKHRRLWSTELREAPNSAKHRTQRSTERSEAPNHPDQTAVRRRALSFALEYIYF